MKIELVNIIDKLTDMRTELRKELVKYSTEMNVLEERINELDKQGKCPCFSADADKTRADACNQITQPRAGQFAILHNTHALCSIT